MNEELIEGQPQEPPVVVDTAEGTPTGPKTYSQEELDRRLQDGIAKNAQGLRDELEKQKMDSKREKLESEGKYEELYKQTSGDIEGLRQEVAQRELNAQTRRELDEAGLSKYAAIFEADLTTMEGRQALIGTLGAMTEGAVKAGVDEKLGTPAPPASPGPPKSVDLNAQIAAADVEAAKTGDWAESTRLKNLKLDQ